MTDAHGTTMGDYRTSRRLIANAVILDAHACAVLIQAARLDELRIRSRTEEALYSLLVDIKRCALTLSTDGKLPTQATEQRHAEVVTPTQIANVLGVTPRTIRNDIKAGRLKATRNGRNYLVAITEAITYASGRKAA